MSSRSHRILSLGLIGLAALFIIGLMIVLAVPRTALALSFRHWDSMFPGWHPLITSYLDDAHACKSNITAYRESWNQDIGQGYDITNCILLQFSEFRKAEMAAAAVILGSVPALLQMLAPTYADTAMLGYRRPILGLLLTAGCPSVRPMHATDHAALVEQWEKKKKPLWDSNEKPTDKFADLFNVAHLLTITAVVNNAQLTYQVGVWATCSFAPSISTLPAIWYISAVLIHLVGWLTMRLRMELTIEDNDDPNDSEGTQLDRVQKLDVRVKEEDVPFLTLVSALYAGCILQILWGTTILSSLLFISARDSALLAIRDIASTLVCRIILILELDRDKQAVMTVNGRPRVL